MDKYEIKECPYCGFHGSVRAVGSIGTTEKVYICPECHRQWHS